MSPRSRATIRDVAAKAGVSHQTVSRVINASEQVNPETRQRVLAAIEALEYQPNAIAQMMARGRTRTLACISPNLTDYTFASIIEGAEQRARQLGYIMMAVSAPDAAAFAQAVDQLVGGGSIEGLLVVNPFIDGRSDYLPDTTPVVLIGALPQERCIDSVCLDEERAGSMATEHLLTLGRRRIAHITGPLVEDCSSRRRDGYLSALEAAGVPFDAALLCEGDWSATSGYLAIQNLLAAQVDFCAVFAQNDRMAVGAIKALREAGKKIPQDVSVIGFDDMPLASYFDPPLTTMRQDIFLIGSEAARLLIRAIEQPDLQCENLRLPVELVLRSSTSVFPGGATAVNSADSKTSVTA